jgi:hypothetical protein
MRANVPNICVKYMEAMVRNIDAYFSLSMRVINDSRGMRMPERIEEKRSILI